MSPVARMGDWEEDWITLSFCHFNDQCNLVEAWTRDHGVINRKVGGQASTYCRWVGGGRRSSIAPP